MCSQTTELGSTHYFQAIALAGLSIVLYVRALRRKPLLAVDRSAALYLLAMLEKETVVPLVVLPLALPDRDFRTRARYAAGHAVALLAYLAARRAVIGTLFGGYGWAVERGEWPSLILALPKKFALGMAGEGVVAGAILLAVIAIGVAASLRNRRADRPLPRRAVPRGRSRRPGVEGDAAPLRGHAVALPLDRVRRGRRDIAPAARGGGGSADRGAGAGRGREPAGVAVRVRADEEDVAMRRASFSTSRRTACCALPIIPPAAMDELSWLKTDYAKREAGAGWFYDDLYLQPRQRGQTVLAVRGRHARSARSNGAGPLSADARERAR